MTASDLGLKIWKKEAHEKDSEFVIPILLFSSALAWPSLDSGLGGKRVPIKANQL